ncbi:DUF488 domain-containing protein [Neobacillus sp. NRS-1170]|uniref:DUF488 domain-containing protein n=1 Tax=Neobacillus sp. NRS-1170 TaxID=3233898 RepID=UPI003D2B1C6B
MSEIFLKRIYEPFDETDGHRILIDRVWPRGISKEAAKLTYWFKDIAPSPELRKWFCHKPELFDEFRSKYIDELRTDKEKLQMIEQIIDASANNRVTLLYGAKDPVYNHAQVLQEELNRKIQIGNGYFE